MNDRTNEAIVVRTRKGERAIVLERKNMIPYSKGKTTHRRAFFCLQGLGPRMSCAWFDSTRVSFEEKEEICKASCWVLLGTKKEVAYLVVVAFAKESVKNQCFPWEAKIVDSFRHTRIMYFFSLALGWIPNNKGCNNTKD